MTNSSKTKNIRTRGGFIIGGTLACTLAMSAFGPAAMASEVDNTAAPDASVVEVVDLRVTPQESTQSTEPVVVVEPPAPAPAAPQADVVSNPPVQSEQVTNKVDASVQSEVVVQTEAPAPAPVPSAPADTTAPKVTIKTGANESKQSNNLYSLISFKLYDFGKIDKAELNGVEKQLVDNQYSDFNAIKVGKDGAVNGKNVLKVYDVAGNVTVVEFTLDATGPTATVKPETTVGADGIYQKVSYKLHDPANVVKAIINGVEKPLTPNVWSDLDTIVPGKFGAVEGLNTLVLVDALGNQSTLTFTLDTTKPVINVPATGQWVSGTHTWNITQTEANPAKTYVEIQQMVDGKWKKFDGAWFYDTNDFAATFDTTKLTEGAQTQIKISTWDKANLHTSATFGVKVDNTVPVISIKPESVGSDGVYSELDLKLHDALSGVKQVSVNGHMLQRTVNKWSDLNDLKPGRDGAVQGENTIVLYDAAGNTTTLVITLDSIAPKATGFSQVYEAKQDGRVAVTLTFDEAVRDLGQGWYGSGTTWTKVYYSSKEHTVTFKDAAGNVGSYTFTVDATAPVVVNELQEWQSDKSRNLTTLTFNEPTTVSSQGWYAQAGSNNTVWSKAIFNTKEYTVEFTDAVGNPGTYTFKAKGQSDLLPPVIGEPEFPETQPETPVVTEPVSNNNGAGNTAATTPVKTDPLPPTGLNVPFGVILSGFAALFGGLLLKLKSIFG